jgi:hypothetical protein
MASHQLLLDRIRGIGLAVTVLSIALVGCGVNPPREARATVVIQSTLHKFHESVEGYSFDALTKIIDNLNPDVLGLELTQAEIERREVQGYKTEYQHCVYPYLARRNIPTFALEPDEPLFSELVALKNRAALDLSKRNPEAKKEFEDNAWKLFGTLMQEWNTPESVNSERTDSIFQEKQKRQKTLYGPLYEESWDRWNGNFADAIRRAAMSSPGKLVLVLVGAEHRYWLRSRLASDETMNLKTASEVLRERPPHPNLSFEQTATPQAQLQR